jgi:hypothetical protein
MNKKTAQINCAVNVTSFPGQHTAEPQSAYVPIATSATPDPALPAITSEQTAVARTTDSAAPPDPFLKIKVESLKRKQRANAWCHSLTPDHAYQIAAWMEEIDNLSEVHRRITAPPPDGLGLKVNFSTLRRLRSAWRAEALAELSDSMFDVITDMEEAQTDFNQSARIQTAINHMLLRKAFELAQTHPGSDVLKDVLTSIDKLSALEYRRQKITLEHEKVKRLTQPSAPQTTTRHHRVDLNIISTPYAGGPGTPPVAKGASPEEIPNARQPVEILAPLPEAVIESE